MSIKSIFKYYFLKESIKEIEINRILDKINKKMTLTTQEKRFLYLYQYTREDDILDFMYISKNTAFKKISELLEKNKIIICNLHDRDGRLGVKIKSIENNFRNETCLINMNNGNRHELHDKFLYNLIYNSKKDQYSLEEQDEYFEKIEINK